MQTAPIMQNVRLDPFLYKDNCEEHGKSVPFIVEPKEVDFILKEIRFIFYCKRCYHQYGNDTCAWRGNLLFKDYNEMFGYKLVPDN